MRAARVGDRVRIHYTGLLADGTIFETTDGGDAFEFELGSDAVLAGLSLGVAGMRPGEEKTIELSPENAYGVRSEGLAHHVPRASLPEDVKEGDSVRGRVGDDEIVLWIASLGPHSVLLDPNHPLAGRSLRFRVELVELVDLVD